MRGLGVFLVLILCSLSASAQEELPFFDFIQYNKNIIVFPRDSSSYNLLYKKLNRLVMQGKGEVSVLHIGDSHIQADYFSGRMREKLQTFAPGLQGARGYIFPYRMAGTNNPFNYKVEFTGEWEGCRNIEQNKFCTLGLAGISATTRDTFTTFTLRIKSTDYIHYDFNEVLILHSADSTSYFLDAPAAKTREERMLNDTIFYTVFRLKDYQDTISFETIQTDTVQNHFTLYGMILRNSDPGIVYNAVGINGADAESFLRCKLLVPELKNLAPDWVIISLGTNDSYVVNFDSLTFCNRYKKLIILVQETLPGVPILLTTPGDNYRRRRYLNKNVPRVRDAIFALASQYNCAVWDYFEVMGGLNSIVKWQKEGFTANDKLHYSKAGYVLQGDLLFAAFLKAYDNYIESTVKP